MSDDAPQDRPPLVYLRDILEEIEFIKQTMSNLSFEQYLGSKKTRYAVERSLEIISEASRGIPAADQAEHPDIPWRQIRDIGNVLRHAYFGMMHPRIWAIVRDDLGPLETAIRSIMARYENPLD